MPLLDHTVRTSLQPPSPPRKAQWTPSDQQAQQEGRRDIQGFLLGLGRLNNLEQPLKQLLSPLPHADYALKFWLCLKAPTPAEIVHGNDDSPNL